MRNLTVFLFVTLPMLVLPGCAKRGKPAAPRTAAPADLESLDPSGQKITFWYQHTREREAEMKALIADFNKTNKWRIEVSGEYAGDYGQIYNKMMAGIQGGEVPNLVVAYQNQAAGYAQADALVDLNPYVNSKKWGLAAEEKADFFPAFWKQDVFPALGGKRLGFPPNRSMEVLYYNEDWLHELGYDAPPATWDEFAAMCRRAAAQPFSKSLGGRSVGWVVSIDASRFAAMVFSRGGNVANKELTAYTLDTPAARETMTLIQQLCQGNAAIPAPDREADQANFAAGRALFNIRSSSGLPFYKSAVDAGAKFKWSAAVLPHSTPEPVQDVYGASVSIPVTTPEAELASWLFLKWLTEPDQQARWAKVSNYFPTRQSTAEAMKDYFATHPTYAKLFAQLKYGKSEPAIPGYDEVRDKVEQAMADVIHGADVQETLTALQAKANQLLKEATE